MVTPRVGGVGGSGWYILYTYMPGCTLANIIYSVRIIRGFRFGLVRVYSIVGISLRTRWDHIKCPE